MKTQRCLLKCRKEIDYWRERRIETSIGRLHHTFDRIILRDIWMRINVDE